jgi:hypothetical protein
MQRLVDELRAKHVQLQHDWRESEGQLTSGEPPSPSTFPSFCMYPPGLKLWRIYDFGIHECWHTAKPAY